LGLEHGDIDRVPQGLNLSDYYERLREWYSANRALAASKLRRSRSDPYVSCFEELVSILPAKHTATPEDIAFVSVEVISGLMEWAYHEKDQDGVKMAAYAHFILDRFFDGFHGKATRAASQRSRFVSYGMRDCIERHRNREVPDSA